MRRLSGFVIALVALLFLGMAYSQLAHADPAADCEMKPSDKPECESALANKIVELVKQDQSKILELQYGITTLKLAQAAGPNGTVEAYLRGQEDLLKKMENTSDNAEIRKKLLVLYQRYGELSDAEKIDAGLDKLSTADEKKTAAVAYRQKKAEDALQAGVDKAKNANYFKTSKTDPSRDLRFRNRDLSAYVLARTLVDGDKAFDQNDASILWFKAQISEGVEAATSRGSLSANLQETSTRVAQITGVAGTVGKSAEETTALLKAAQDGLNAAFDAIILTYKDELKKSCAEMNTCATCGDNTGENRVTDEHRTKALSKAIGAIAGNLQKCDAAREEAIGKAMAGLAVTKARPKLDSEEGTGTAVKVDPAQPSETANPPRAAAKPIDARKAADSVAGKTPPVPVSRTNPGDSLPGLRVETDSVFAKPAGVDSLPKIDSLAKPDSIPGSQQTVSLSAPPKVLAPPSEGKITANSMLMIQKVNSMSALNAAPVTLTYDPVTGFRLPALTEAREFDSCRVRYAVNSGVVRFEVLSKNVIVCSATYVVGLPRAESAAWDPSAASAACRKGSGGIDLGLVCKKASP